MAVAPTAIPCASRAFRIAHGEARQLMGMPCWQCARQCQHTLWRSCLSQWGKRRRRYGRWSLSEHVSARDRVAPLWRRGTQARQAKTASS